MTEIEAIWAIARDDLVLVDRDGRPDVLIRDHSLRVAQSALRLAELPDLADRRRDRVALFAACAYHDAGWILDYRDQRVAPNALLATATSEVQREMGATWMEQRLTGHMSEAGLALAAAAIRQCNRKDTTLTEAHLVAEAENLDEIGPLTVVLMLRRCSSDPRGLTAVLETWERQREYQYWPARIRDCFRLDVTRKLAAQRLADLEPFMDSLRRLNGGEDLTEQLESLGVPAATVPTA